MPIVIADYRAAIDHLPPGAVLRVDDVPWEEYERLLTELGEGYAVRIVYDRGRMEIMAPSPAHERSKSHLGRLVIAIGDELDIDVESLGSTTLKHALAAQGAEPDNCFYVQNASRILGKEDLDLAYDPPPDLALEVEQTSASLDKLAIYAALRVPEVWRLTRQGIRMYWLAGNRYEESSVSRAFPFLTVETLSRFVEEARRDGGRKATRASRVWVREHGRR